MVVTLHVPDVVPPTLTVAVVVVNETEAEVWRMAIVSPGINPVTVVLPHELLRAIAVQPVPHVAV